jgi:O-antigen ligase
MHVTSTNPTAVRWHASNLRETARLAAPWLVVAGVALFAGILATGEADARLGQTPALLLLAGLLAITFLVVFSFLGSLAIIVWPVAATGGYLLGIPRAHPVITFDRVWIGGMVAYIALNPRRTGRSTFTRPLLVGLLWLVVAYGLRAFATSATIGGPAATWFDAIVLPAILFVACERYCLAGAGRARRLMGALMIAGGVLATIGIAERIFGFQLATIRGGTVRFDAAIDQTRISGPYPFPEPYALSLIICFAATLYWIQSRRRGDSYRWALVLAVLQVTAIAFVYFRAAWIAAVVVVIAAFGIRPGRFGRMFAVTGIVAALVLAATSELQQNKSFSTRASNTTNVYGRLAAYKQSLDLFESAPFFGVGVNRYHEVAFTRPPVTVSNVKAPPDPHDSYAQVLAEQGIVGLLPLLLLSYGVWRLVSGLRAASFWSKEALLLTGPLAGAALGYLIMSLTLAMLPYEPSNAFLAVMLGAASARLDTLARRDRVGVPRERAVNA